MVDGLDWSEAVERLRREKEELAELNARLAAEKLGLEHENVKLKEELEKAQGRIEELHERIDELERTAARQAAPFRRRESLKVVEKKRPGRPVGHRGVRRPRPPHVDHVVEQPLPACPHCGAAVHDRAPLTQYIEELPPVRPVVTRLTTWKGICPQCARSRARIRCKFRTAKGPPACNSGRGPSPGPRCSTSSSAFRCAKRARSCSAASA